MSDKKFPAGGFPVMIGEGANVRILDWSLIEKKEASEAMPPAEFVIYWQKRYPKVAQDIHYMMTRLRRTRVCVRYPDNPVDFIKGNRAGEDGTELTWAQLEAKHLPKKRSRKKGARSATEIDPWNGIRMDPDKPCC